MVLVDISLLKLLLFLSLLTCICFLVYLLDQIRHESEVAIVEQHNRLRSENSNEAAIIDPMRVPDVAPLKKRRYF